MTYIKYIVMSVLDLHLLAYLLISNIDALHCLPNTCCKSLKSKSLSIIAFLFFIKNSLLISHSNRLILK